MRAPPEARHFAVSQRVPASLQLPASAHRFACSSIPPVENAVCGSTNVSARTAAAAIIITGRPARGNAKRKANAELAHTTTRRKHEARNRDCRVGGACDGLFIDARRRAERNRRAFTD